MADLNPQQRANNGRVRTLRRMYNKLGFSRGYNFFFYVFFAGAFLGFALARFMFIDVNNTFCGPGFSPTRRASPGECYFFRAGLDRTGMLLHLACILPAAVLVVFQFLPAIRHRWLLVHRVNGYIILLLSVAGTVGALIVTRHAFGGGPVVHTGFGTMAVMFLVALLLAYINIRRLQIEQHRAWMLRAWFYAGSVVTIRPIMFISAMVVTKAGDHYVAMPCKVIEFLVGSQSAENSYPSCTSPDAWAPVLANFSDTKSPLGPAASLRLSFGMAAWLALALHAIGIELYLHLTPAETERLRNVSYQRQLEAGMKHPGRAGLTSDRLGDAEYWNPAQKN